MARLPSLFVSHGAPTFALEPGRAGPALTALGRRLPRPAAVLVVSPHWMTPTPRVGTAPQPATIHDFGGFDPALYQLTYPAAGHPALAQRAIERLDEAGWPALADGDRGLDHGAWVPLMHLFPDADLPVFQVSLPSRLDANAAWAFGQALAPLADDGVLIVGSGSLTHNLVDFRSGHGQDEAYAAEFAAWVRDAVQRGDRARLLRTLDDAPHARRAHPTPEHFWPLLVAAGAADPAQPAHVIEGGITHGVLAMDAFAFGRVGVPAGTGLRLEARRTVLSADDGTETVLAVGVQELADAVFRHEPPTPHELEQAIDRVEDALMATGLRPAARGELCTEDLRLLALPGLQAPGDRLAREDVEALFQRLASASLGHPGLLEGWPAGREAAAALLVLRECLHHLGFDGIRRALPPLSPPAETPCSPSRG